MIYRVFLMGSIKQGRAEHRYFKFSNWDLISERAVYLFWICEERSHGFCIAVRGTQARWESIFVGRHMRSTWQKKKVITDFEKVASARVSQSLYSYLESNFA